MQKRSFGIALLVCLAVKAEAADIKGTVTVPFARDSRNVVVYIERKPGQTFPQPVDLPVAVLDQLNLAFKPHVLPIQVGTRVRFPNSDDIRHNVFAAAPVDGKRLNLGTYPSGTSKDWVFNTLGVVTLLCNVHIEMSAYIVVVETPYFAVTESSGSYVIKDVPPGTYTLKTWHEKKGSKPSVAEVTVTASGASQNFALQR